MSFRTALDHLAALSVPGVTSYDIAAVPAALSRAQLPALLTLPVDVQDDALFKERGAGFTATAFSGGGARVSYALTHLLLVAPTGSGSGLRGHLPALIDLIDAYFATLAADPTLTGALAEPAQVRVEPGVFAHGAGQYHGCAFRHVWSIEVTP